MKNDDFDPNRLKQEHDTLIESLEDIIFEVKSDGSILNCWTSDPEKLFMDSLRFLNSSIHEIFPRLFAEKVQELIDSSFRNSRSYRLKYSSPFENQTGRWYELQTKILKGNHQSLAIIVRDITPQINLESLVKIKEEKFNHAFMDSSVGMLLLDRELLITECNSEFYRILGTNFDICEHRQAILPLISPSYRKGLKNGIKKIFSGQQDKFRLECEFIGLNGIPIWCLLSLSAVRSSKEDVLYLICQLQDLSLVKENSRRLKIQKEMLEKSNFELNVRLRQLEIFNQVLSHTLRAPIANNAMIIDQMQGKGTDLQEMVGLLKINNSKYLKLFDNLIGFLERTEDKDLSFRDNDINKIVKDAFTEITRLIGHTVRAIPVTETYEKKIYFPAYYVRKILIFAVLQSLTYRQLGPVHRFRLSSKATDSAVEIHLNWLEIPPPINRTRDQTPSIKISDELIMDEYISEHQITSFGGSVKFNPDRDAKAILLISIPKA